MALTLSAAMATAAVAQQAPASAVTGPGTVTGSDVVVVGGQSFSLSGIDAIEFHQFCFVDGKPWVCGASAMRALQTLVDPGDISCTPAGPPEDGNIPAVCTASGLDLAEAMVVDGWAEALPGGPYAELEAEAKALQRGVWVADFIPPAAYRDMVTQLEAKFSDSLLDLLSTSGAAMLGDPLLYDAMEDYEVVVAADATGLEARELRVEDIPPGFIEASIPEREVFDWTLVAERVNAFQQGALRAVRLNAAEKFWRELKALPKRTIKVTTPPAFYTAMIESAREWIAAGRQPILFIRSPLVPTWMPLWLGDEPPTGGNVSLKTNMPSSLYVATIDGIDLYVGDVPDTASVLLPADLLERITYAAQPGGGSLAVTRESSAAGPQLVARFALGLEWRDDEIVWLEYPKAEGEVLLER